MDVAAYMAERSPLVERALEAALPGPEEPPRSLHAAMRHLLFPGGKRLRPALALAAAEAVGAPPERALPAAVAVELIHTYSLVHDDLPCMDDDATRRGRPTVHLAFDEATAVLAGDALQAAAFGALSRLEDPEGAEQRLAAACDLAWAAGSRALVGGQADDLAFDGTSGDAAQVESIHSRKSAALITAALVTGARLGGADAATLESLRRCGEAAGLAFQIADDLLDAEEEEACSLATLLGLDGARRRAEELLAEALAAIEGLGERGEPLRELVRYAVRREA